MVHLSTRFLFSAFYLSTRASFLLASIKCCPGDSTCSQCWMCNGSDLRNCWDQAVTEIEDCAKISDDNLTAKLQCYCTSYSHLALCWKPGTCCSEFSPTLAAAGNLCNLLTHPADQITTDLFHKVLNDAVNTRQTIYHNDRGTDVPKLQMYVKASSDDLSESSSHYTRNITSHIDHVNKYLVNVASNNGREDSQSKDKSNYKNDDSTTYQSKYNANYKSKHDNNYNSKSETENLENKKNSASKLQGTTPIEKSEQQPQQSEVYKSQSNHKAKSHDWSAHDKIHHQAKCSRQHHKCQSAIANQYHNVRRDKSGHNLVKRGRNAPSQPQSSLSSNLELWKRSSARCGLDFQGVPYPTEIPHTVSKEFAKFEKEQK